MDQAARLIGAVAALLGAVAWPVVVIAVVYILGPSLRQFLSALSEVRLKGAGFEASAVRRLNLDATSQQLHDFWKPQGKVDRSNAARITSCMRQLGIGGSIAGLINAGTSEDRASVLACLSRQP